MAKMISFVKSPQIKGVGVILSELIPNEHEVSDPFIYQHIKLPWPKSSEEKSLVSELRSEVRQRSKVKFPG